MKINMIVSQFLWNEPILVTLCYEFLLVYANWNEKGKKSSENFQGKAALALTIFSEDRNLENIF